MPPDSSITPNPQARPCATLALRPGWLASGLGVGARTGLHAELTAYSIVFWGHDALPAQDMVAWQQEKARLMTEMSLAGQKGAYGKLGALSSGLNRAFDDHIELSLRAGAGTHVRTEEVQALANGLAEETSCRVLAWSVCRNHVHVIAELTEEKGVDELVCSWKALAPSMNWEDAYHTEALKAREAAARVDALISELGDDAAAAVDAEADGADSGNGFRHITVLLHETVDMLKAGPGKFIVDCTLGGGGHTELLLEQGATVWGIDRDADARRAAMLRLARFGSRFKVLAGNFQDVESILSQQGVSRVDGLLADLGVSSHQLDTASRGFSFREDGPLDMRMDTRAALSARNLVNEAPEEEIANILWQFGEERASRAIARAMVKARAQAPITTTAQLARIVESVLPRKGRQHPGTRTFQALRIAVNGELDALDALLDSSVRLLGQGGRMAVITFHSLEDRRVKQFFDLRSRPEIDRPEWPAPRPNPDYCFRPLSRKPVTAGEEELSTNPRSRSAKLRGGKKISCPSLFRHRHEKIQTAFHRPPDQREHDHVAHCLRRPHLRSGHHLCRAEKRPDPGRARHQANERRDRLLRTHKGILPFQDFLPDQPLGHPRQAGPGQVQPAAYRALSRRIHFFRKRLPHRCGRPLTALSRS